MYNYAVGENLAELTLRLIYCTFLKRIQNSAAAFPEYPKLFILTFG